MRGAYITSRRNDREGEPCVTPGRPLLAWRRQPAEEPQGPAVKPFTPDPSGLSGGDPLATAKITFQPPGALAERSGSERIAGH
jgi:hypothetical protein